MNTRWIEGFKGKYQITDRGDVISWTKSAGRNRVTRSSAKKLAQTNDKDGYKVVMLCKENTRKTCRVHRLVAEAFLDNPFNKTQVNHKDSDPSNNNLRNLEWVTPSENQYHAYKNGNKEQYIGEEHHNSKLTEDDIKWIRSYYKKGEYTQKELADIFNTGQQYISKIVRRKVWKHI